ncbi:hypothetical protein [Mucilaginibacter sp. FT3.2]|uniref:hypothetical protein n=1 Tax=Mucilaginibacter sp. FT3.2 TaxID=2723090 RepID=UPI001616A544|nr:hypothetical protein [Mucilaginibacter sp. FT3.2]MBB6231917.1 hypothetical protein [Mucilaginibacter sp. FT3.2]
MEEFYIDVTLSRGTTRIQVEEIPPEQWDMPYTPQFIIEFYHVKGFITLTLQLERGKWYDRNTRISEDDFHLRYFELGPDAFNPNYQSPLTDAAIQEIGSGIARHMIVMLTYYMGYFVPVFREPTFN